MLCYLLDDGAVVMATNEDNWRTKVWLCNAFFPSLPLASMRHLIVRQKVGLHLEAVNLKLYYFLDNHTYIRYPSPSQFSPVPLLHHLNGRFVIFSDFQEKQVRLSVQVHENVGEGNELRYRRCADLLQHCEQYPRSLIWFVHVDASNSRHCFSNPLSHSC